MSLRFDVLTGRQVIVASNRNERPGAILAEPALKNPRDGDPFLRGDEVHTPWETLALRKKGSCANDPQWLVRVVPNLYPVVSSRDVPLNPVPDALLPEQTAVGIHEVVIETPDERRRLTELTAAETARVLLAWQYRMQQIEELRGVQTVSIFHNEGFSAGASLPHLHSQIVTVNTIPGQVRERLARSQAWREHHGSDLLQDFCDAEIRDGERVLYSSENLLVVCPFAGRSSWHVRIVPRYTEPQLFSRCSTETLCAIAGCLHSTAVALDRCLGPVSLNVNLVHPPNTAPEYGWFIDLVPRTTRMAGFELVTDLDVVTVRPESAAVQLSDKAEWCFPQREEVEPSGYVWRP